MPLEPVFRYSVSLSVPISESQCFVVNKEVLLFAFDAFDCRYNILFNSCHGNIVISLLKIWNIFRWF